MAIARRNAKLLLQYATIYPFRLPDNSMTCVLCESSYENPSEFRDHFNTDHFKYNVAAAFAHLPVTYYLKVDCTEMCCKLCEKSFEVLHDMAVHLMKDHTEGCPLNLDHDLGLQPFKVNLNRYYCVFCELKFYTLRSLSRHTQTHFLKYTCESCGKSYSTSTALNSHVRFSHIDLNMKICRRCKRTFSSLEARRTHIMASRRCWPHVCTTCGDRFINSILKQNHMVEVHGTQKKYHSCSECGRNFDCRKKYRYHFKIKHTDDFKCACCELKFDTKKKLEEHKFVHTKEKLFHCGNCSKSFSSKKSLVQHMWIHNEFKRFECKPCNKKFNQRVSWKTHMKSYHPDLVNFDEGK